MSLTFIYTNIINGTVIRLPIKGITSPININWGNGFTSSGVFSDNPSRTYIASDAFIQINVTGGVITRIGSNNAESLAGIDKLTEIRSFGQYSTNNNLTSLEGLARNATSLTVVPTSINSNVTNLSTAFSGATIFNQNISTWDVSNVTNMSFMFSQCTNFNQNIGNWNVSNVTNMSAMFSNCTNFNQNIGNWNTLKVNTMRSMFNNCIKFNQNISSNIVLNYWNVSNVTDMFGMFNNCTTFNQPLNSWTVSKVTNMNSMFNNCTTFNQPLNNWDVSNVNDMSSMFFSCTNFNQDIGNWNVSKVTNMQNMFRSATTFSNTNYNSLLVGWSGLTMLQSNVVFDMNNTVLGVNNHTTKYSYGEPSDARFILTNTRNWTITDGGISGMPRPMILEYIVDSDNLIITLPLNGSVNTIIDWGDGLSNLYFTTGDKSHTYLEVGSGTYQVQITNTLTQFGDGDFEYPNADRLYKIIDFGEIRLNSLSGAFNGAINLIQITALPSINSTITDLSYCFQYADGFNDSYITNWNVSDVTNMSNMFRICNTFNQPLNNWNVSKVTNMSSLFDACLNFNQPLNSWNVSNVTDMNMMFRSCTNFNQPLNSWNVSKVTNMFGMFDSCSNFNQPLNNWNVSNVTNMQFTFANCNNFNQNIGNWNVSKVTDMIYMFLNATSFNTTNYDSLLIGWSGLTGLKYNVRLDINDTTKYTYGTALDARFILTKTRNWIITDGGISGLPRPMILEYIIDYDNFEITLPLYGYVNTTVDWGDGMTNQYTSAGDFSHTYSPDEPRTYQVQIINTLTQFGNGYYSYSNADRLYKIIDFGEIRLNSLSGAFNLAENLIQITALPSINSTITDLSYCFFQALNFNDSYIANWDVSRVTNMNSMFIYCDIFNQNIENWDVSNVTNMDNMFYNCYSFNKPLNNWNVSKVTTMDSMFSNCEIFNQDIGNWDVSNVTNMYGMFLYATSFSTTNYDSLLIGWSGLTALQSNVYLNINDTTKYSYGAASDAKLSLITKYGWIITDGNVDMTTLPTPMSLTYRTITGNRTITLPLYGIVDVIVDWGDGFSDEYITPGNKTHNYNSDNTFTVLIKKTLSNFGNAGATYLNADRLTKVNNFGEIRLRSLSGAFRDAINLTQITALPSINSTITDLSHCFRGATGFNDSYITNWNVSGVTGMSYMFNGASLFNQNISSWDITGISGLNDSGMTGIFTNSGLTDLNYTNILNSWGGKNVNSNITLGAGTVKYYDDGLTGRNTLISKGWRIIDGGGSIGPIPQPMILTYVITSPNTNIVLPIQNITAGLTVNINWGDSQTSSITTNNPSNTYALAGTYTITITGIRYNLFRKYGDFNQKQAGYTLLKQINSFGNIPLTEMSFSFSDGITSVPTNIPSTLTSLAFCFTFSTNFNPTNIEYWNVSKVTNMLYIFAFCSNFNKDISNWDVSNVTNIGAIFQGCSNFNQNISNWNVSKVENMSYMFSQCTNFNQNLGNWNVSKVTNMQNMFTEATSFSTQNYNSLLIGWSGLTGLKSNVTLSMNGTTKYSYGQPSDGRFILTNTRNWTITDGGISGMPRPMILEYIVDSDNLTITLPLNGSVNTIVNWGDGRTNLYFTTGDQSHTYLEVGTGTYQVQITNTLTQFGKGNATYSNADRLYKIIDFGEIRLNSLSGAFMNATNMIQITALPSINSTISDLSYCFMGATAFNDSYITNWNVAGVTNMNYMFYDASSFGQILQYWDITGITSINNNGGMSGMFVNSNLISLAYTYTIIGWSNQNVNSNIILGANNIDYYDEGITARNNLISKGWNIIDGELIGPIQIPMELIYSNITPGTTITIQINNVIDDYIIDWGDNIIESLNYSKPSHTYSKNYSIIPISIRNYTYRYPSFNHFGIDDPLLETITGINKLTNVITFGGLYLTSLKYAFYNASSLTGLPSTLPNNVILTDTSYMLKNSSIFNQSLNNWNVSQVTNMESMFENALLYNQSIANWNITNVINMNNMLKNTSFNKVNYELLLNNWSGLTGTQSNVNFHAGSAEYSYGTPSQNKYILKKNYNWIITDGGITNLPQPMILEYNITSPSQSIRLPLYEYVDVMINWGDGSLIEEIIDEGDILHTYSSSGTYQVKIENRLTKFGNGNLTYTNADKLTKVINFGEIGLNSLSGAFRDAISLTQITALPSINSTITDLSYCFKGATGFNDSYINNWNVSGVTNMESMFENAKTFNQSIENLNVLQVTNMSKMFKNAETYNQPLNNWASKTSNVIDMSYMFNNAYQFNQDINNWIVSGVTNMDSMFENASQFNQDLSDWNITNVLSMNNMFKDATLSKTNYDFLLSSWHNQILKEGINFHGGNSTYTYGLVSDKRLAIIKDYGWTIIDGGPDPATLPPPMILEYMTTAPSESITLPLYGKTDVIINWGDGSQIEEIYNEGDIIHNYLLAGTYTVTINKTLTRFGKGSSSYDNVDKLIKVIDFGGLRTTDLSGAFNGAINLVEVTGIPTILSITDLSYTFKDAISMNDSKLSNSHTVHVKNMVSTFENAVSFDQSLANWNVTGVTAMNDMFKDVTLSSENYSNTLISWSNQNVQSNIIFNGGNSQYLYGNGSDAVLSLKKNKNWTFIDGGITNLPEPMILEYNITAASQSIILPLYGIVDVLINWGDGSPIEEIINEGDLSHTYASIGTYQVIINNKLTQFGKGSLTYFNADKLTKVIDFGEIKLESLSGAFRNAINLTQITALPSINSTIRDLSYCFKGATGFNDQYIKNWDVSQTTNMTSMFEDAKLFNQSLSNWVVTGVTAMNNMFKGIQLSKVNYDDILISWSGQYVKSNVNFNAGSSIYSFKDPEYARYNLIYNYQWIITDGGRELNNAPVVSDIEVNIISTINISKTITLIAYDEDNHPLTFSIMSLPINGSLSDIDINTNTVIYTPYNDISIVDSFTYKTYDGKQYSNIGNVTINIRSTADQFNDVLNNLNLNNNFPAPIKNKIVSDIVELSINNDDNINLNVYLNLLNAYKFGATITVYDIDSGITYLETIDTIEKKDSISIPISAELLANNFTRFTVIDEIQKDLLKSSLVENYSGSGEDTEQLNFTLAKDIIIYVIDPFSSDVEIIDLTNIDLDVYNIFFNIPLNTSIILKNGVKTKELMLKSESYNIRYYMDITNNRRYYLGDKIYIGIKSLSIIGFGSSLLGFIEIPPPNPDNFAIYVYVDENENKTVTLPLKGVSSITINWGDDSPLETYNMDNNYQHIYLYEGIYQIKISGNMTKFGNGYDGYMNVDKIINVLGFGILGIISLSGAFKDAVNLTEVPNSLPGTVQDISYMFYNASSFNDNNVLNWDLSNVKNINYMFLKATLFNQNIGNWNISNNLEKWKFIYYQAQKYKQIPSGWIYNKIINLT